MSRSPLRRAFDTVERALGGPLERLTHSEEFADAVAVVQAVEAGGRALYQRVTADALHRINVPAWSDVARLQRQLARLERRLADLSRELERSHAPLEVDGSHEQAPPAHARQRH
jgi:hypothetical protein